MTAISQWKKSPLFRHGLVAILFFLIALFLYRSIINIGFLSDDWHSLFIAAKAGPVWKFFVTNIIGTRSGSTYAPMWNMLFSGEYALFNLWATGYHLISLLLFVASAFLLYWLAIRLFNGWLIGFIAGVLFLLLPCQVESVAWISVQLHLLAAFLYLASLVAYERFVTAKSKKHYLLALFLAFLSLLTKEIGITFIAGFLLIDLYKKTPWRLALKRLILPVLVIGAYLWLRFSATGILFGYYGQAQGGKSPAEMMRMFIEMTVNLFFSYPERVIFTNWLFNHLFVYLVLVILFLTAAWLIFQRQRKQMAYALAMFAITALPPLLSVAYNALGNEGERYLYLPSFFAALLFAVCLRAMLQRWRRAFIPALIILIFIGLISWPQISLKNNNWILAGQVVKNGFQSYSALNLPSTAAMIFIGLPDSLQGAQLFRNATKEALNLRGTWLAEGERVLMSPVLTKENFDQEIMAVQKIDNITVQFTPKAGVNITGLPSVKTKYGQATLTNFQPSDQTGEQIRFEIDKEVLAEAKKNGILVFLIYFNAGSFQALPLD